MEPGFIHESGVGTHPTVTVWFAIEDWKSRDAFVKHFQLPENIESLVKHNEGTIK